MSRTEMPFASRLRYALRWALGHLIITVVVAALASLLVFGFWYPSPWKQMLGVASVFWLVIAVDVVCGPTLTLILASPKKSQRERMLDLSLVAVIQLLALAYGLWAVFFARPVALVFDVDRMVVVTANEVQIEQLKDAPKGLQHLPWAGVHMASLRQPIDADEFLTSVEQSLQGVTQPMRPAWWRPLEDARGAIDLKARPLEDLLNKRSGQRDLLLAAATDAGLPATSLRYLPLTSSKTLDWIVLLDPGGQFVGHAPVDGFVE